MDKSFNIVRNKKMKGHNPSIAKKTIGSFVEQAKFNQRLLIVSELNWR